eukprot:RCo019169
MMATSSPGAPEFDPQELKAPQGQDRKEAYLCEPDADLSNASPSRRRRIIDAPPEILPMVTPRTAEDFSAIPEGERVAAEVPGSVPASPPAITKSSGSSLAVPGGSFNSLKRTSKVTFKEVNPEDDSYGYVFKEEEEKGPPQNALESELGESGLVEEVTQAEYNNWFRLFQSFDKDGSGTIDVSELTQVMQALGVSMTDDEARLLISDLDTNQSGTLSFDDFLQLMLRNRDIFAAARGRSNAKR